MSADLELTRLALAAGSAPGDLDGLPAVARRHLAVAVAVGAPLLDALDAAQAVEDDRLRAVRAVDVASAQGRAVVAGLGLAPFVLVPALAALFDVDLIAYHRTPVGTVTGLIGAALLLTGVGLAHAAVRQVGRPPRAPHPVARFALPTAVAAVIALALHPVAGLVVGTVLAARRPPRAVPVDPRVAEAADLTAVGVAGGSSPSRALREAATHLPELAAVLRRLAFDLERGRPAPPPTEPGLARLTDVLTTAAAVGAPVGPSLRRFAADVRADDLARVLAAAERLPVRLTFPTALAALPGVLLLVGAPIVHGALAAGL